MMLEFGKLRACKQALMCNLSSDDHEPTLHGSHKTNGKSCTLLATHGDVFLLSAMSICSKNAENVGNIFRNIMVQSACPECIHMWMPSSQVLFGRQVIEEPMLCASRVSKEMRSTFYLSVLHCRICVIGMRTCFRRLKVMP